MKARGPGRRDGQVFEGEVPGGAGVVMTGSGAIVEAPGWCVMHMWLMARDNNSFHSGVG